MSGNTPHGAGDRSGRSRSLWLAALLISALASAFHIRHLMEHGALALPPTYDDVSYLLDGARYLDLLNTGGIGAIVRAYLAAPPHAPISTGAALIGFSLAGFHNWIGAATNAVVLFFFSRVFLGSVRDLPLAQSCCLLVVLWLSPFIGTTLWWFRPDMFASLAIAAGGAFIVTRDRWISEPRDWAIAGCFLGLALWSKPTVFPLTLALFGGAIGLVSIGAFLDGKFRGIAQAGAASFAIGVLIASPNYILSIGTIINYINDVVFGKEADIWVRPLPLRETLTFYITGYYGKISVGWWGYASLAVFVACVALLAIRGEYTRLAMVARMVAFVAICYVAVTVPTFKGPHGYPFAAALLVATVLGIAMILRGVPRLAGTALAVGAVIVSLALFNWPFMVAQRFVTAEEARTRHGLVDAMLRALGEDRQSKQVLFSTSTSYTNAFALQFAQRRRDGPIPQYVVLHRTADMAEHIKAISTADVVVAYSPDHGGVIPNLPTATPRFRQDFISAVENSGLFGRPDVIIDPIDGGSILISTRQAAADKVEVLDGETGTDSAAAFVPSATLGSAFQMSAPVVQKMGTHLVVSMQLRRSGPPSANEALFFHLLDKQGNIVGQLGRAICSGCQRRSGVQRWIERFVISEQMKFGVTAVGIGILGPTEGSAPLQIVGDLPTDWNGHRIVIELPKE